MKSIIIFSVIFLAAKIKLPILPLWSFQIGNKRPDKVGRETRLTYKIAIVLLHSSLQ